MTTNPPPDARNARIYVATANVAVMDILSGREHISRAVTEVRPLLAGRGYATPAGPRLHSLADVFACAAAQGVKLRLDGSEIQVRRPKAGRPGRRAFVSGKKKQNTIKFTKVSDERGRTLRDGAFRPGRMHDQTALQTDGIDDLLDQHPDVQAEMDSGYRGLRRDHPAQVSVPPLKPRKDAAPQTVPGLGAGPPRSILGPDLRGARHRRQQALAVPAALDRAARGPARDHPGDRLAGVRPRRRLVTRRHHPITREPWGRTPTA